MLKKFSLRLMFFSIALLFSFGLSAKTFQNAYISFEILESWECNIEQSEWICRSKDANESKEAVIILTAKEKGPTDTFPLYQSHMDNPIQSSTSSGGSLSSRVVYKSAQVKYNNLLWLDGLHQDSEVRGFFTRYLATVKDQIAILVTFSAHKNFYAKHSKHFNDTIKSIRVIATSDLFKNKDIGVNNPTESFGNNNAANNNALLEMESGTNSAGKKSIFDNELFLGLGLLGLAAVLYFIFKVMKNRG